MVKIKEAIQSKDVELQAENEVGQGCIFVFIVMIISDGAKLRIRIWGLHCGGSTVFVHLDFNY